MKKKVLVLATLFTVIALAAIGGTVAYMTANAQKTNTFTPGALQTDIIENGSSTPSTDNSVPATGNQAKKEVTVENIQNTNSIDCYVRVALVPSWVADGNTQMGDFTVAFRGNHMVLGTGDREVKLLLHENWTKNWIYKDGYFYYKKVLHPGEQTEMLLQKVLLDKDYWSQFNLEVLSDSVQAGGNAISQINGWKDAVTVEDAVSGELKVLV